jgi:phage gp36-like protein
MAHITANELGELSALPTEFFTQLSEDEPGTIAKQLEASTSWVNGYLMARYPLQLSQPGPEVKQAVANHACYHLASRVGYQNGAENSDIRQRYEDSLQWLRDVARGTVTLDSAASTARPRPIAEKYQLSYQRN